MIESKKGQVFHKILAYICLTVVALVCALPFLMILSASFSEESLLITKGYTVFPRGFTLEAYSQAFKHSEKLFRSYATTIFVTSVGGTLATLITSLTAYPLSRRSYKFRKGTNLFIYFTMLFSGGAIPSYILISQYLHLRNNVLVLLLPTMVSAWNVFMLRTTFQQIPTAVIEAAKIDGASEWKTFFTIVFPMSVTGIATIFLLIALSHWNEWYYSLMYMTDEKIVSLQYYLSKTMSNVDEILRAQQGGSLLTETSSIPSETTRMAMCVLAAGPMVFIFMFFQRFFVGGISVGSVKG